VYEKGKLSLFCCLVKQVFKKVSYSFLAAH